MPMDVRVGDVLTMKKKHPCGCDRWTVLRSGMDFRLRCLGCGHEVMLPRAKAEKGIKRVERPGTGEASGSENHTICERKGSR